MSTTSALPPSEAPTPASAVRIVPIMISLTCALIPVQLDAMVTATALPTIAGDLGDFGRIAWIATLYLLTMAIGTAAGGRLGDLFGRKSVLLGAQIVFLAGSAWAALAGNMSGLLLARALQGVGAGVTLTTLIATVADIAPPAKRSRYQSVFGAVAPLSMIVGPWIGGIVTDHLGWRWIFALNIPVVLLAMVGVTLLLRLPRPARAGKIDALGLIAISVTGTGWVLAGSWIGQYGWLSGHVVIAGAVGLVGVVATCAVERRASHPFLPRSLASGRSVPGSVIVLALGMGAVLMAAVNFLPIFLQLVQGRSAANSGLLLLPMLLPAIVVALLVGHWTSAPSRFRPTMITGTAILVVGCVLTATMGVHTPVWQTMAYMIILGAGVGMLFQTPVVLVQNSVPAEEVGAATGGASFLRMLAGAVGVGTLGSIFTNRLTAGLADAGPASQGLTASSLDPAELSALPSDAAQAVIDAAASANSLLFVVTTALAVAAFVAAVALPTTPREEPAPRQ